MLLLDMGNSAIKGQYWASNVLQSSFSCRLTDEWPARLLSLLSGIAATHCYYASVANSELESTLRRCLDQVEGLQHYERLITQQSTAGVSNGYTQYEKLGIDRWLALLAANDFDRSVDKLIIDAGSAITVDLLTKHGKHLGGAILPGFNTSIARFRQIMNKADFDHPDINRTDKPGCSTEACIHINSGTSDINRTTDTTMVDQLIDRWFKQLDPDAIMIVTGGDASRISRHHQHPRYEIPDLVLRGMRQQLDNQE